MEIIETLQCVIEKSSGNIEDMQFIFYVTANKLINNYVLQIGDIEIELKELEFYFYDKDKHPDEYTHRDERQTRMEELYVHGKNNNQGGIDITFGDGKYYGGILIRGIKIDNEFVYGPAKVRQKIIQKLNLDDKINYETLQKELENRTLKITPKEKNKNKEKECLYIYSREGLNNEFNKFTHALYRFIDKQYFLENKNYNNKIKNKEKIRAVSFRIYGKKIDNDYNPKKIEKEIENYCNEQNCKYHICYFVDSLKLKINEKEKNNLFRSCV